MYFFYVFFYTEIGATLNLLVRHNVNILASGGVGPDRFRPVTDSAENHRPPKPRPVNLNCSLYNPYYNTQKRYLWQAVCCGADSQRIVESHIGLVADRLRINTQLILCDPACYPLASRIPGHISLRGLGTVNVSSRTPSRTSLTCCSTTRSTHTELTCGGH